MSNDIDAAGVTGPDTVRRLRRPAAIAAAIVVVLVVAAVAWNTTRDETVPYDDPASSGLLTLCDTKGNAVTGGKITDKPFAPLVLGETPLDARVGDDVVPIATLYGYQPREGVEPVEFSGSPIGGPVPFADREKPATRIVDDAWSLANFTEVFPAKVDGYVQLRLIVSAAGFGAFTGSYDTADIKVDNDSWKLVRGGSASCADASSLVAAD